MNNTTETPLYAKNGVTVEKRWLGEHLYQMRIKNAIYIVRDLESKKYFYTDFEKSEERVKKLIDEDYFNSREVFLKYGDVETSFMELLDVANRLSEAAQKALHRLNHYNKNMGGECDVIEPLEIALSKYNKKVSEK